MEILTILTNDAPELYKLSKHVDLPNPEMEKIAKDMFYTMKMSGGIGLAAPQVGVNVRIITIDTTSSGGKTMCIMMNPHISNKEGECEFIEGCLSFPGKSVKTKRASSVTVQYQDFNGKKVVRSYSGIDAVCIQHEIDHLDGKTFYEREIE